MPDPLTTALAGVTGAAAAVNGWYFARYVRSRARSRGRRLAAGVLALLFCGIALQSASAAASLPATGAASLLPSAGRWLVAAGTLAATGMIARRALRG